MSFEEEGIAEAKERAAKMTEEEIITAGTWWETVALSGVPVHPRHAAYGNWFIREADRLHLRVEGV